MPRRHRVPVVARAARLNRDQLCLAILDPACEPVAQAAVERMHRLRARRRLPRRIGLWRCRRP